MSACGCEVDENPDSAQRRVLRWALALNAVMFVIGFIAGIAAESTGLLADSLDMLADASAYGIALAALGRSVFFKARAAGLSGSLLMVLGAGVLVDVTRRGLAGAHPESTSMPVVATLSLLVNTILLLRPYRPGEVHLRATWIVTRVDVIANLAVLFRCARRALDRLGLDRFSRRRFHWNLRDQRGLRNPGDCPACSAFASI